MSAYLVRSSYRNLSLVVHDQQILRELSRTASIRAYHVGMRHRYSLEQKMEYLCGSSVWEKYSSTDSVLNYSSRILSRNQLTVLGLGLSFNMSPSNKNTISTVAEFDTFSYVYRGRVGDHESVRGLISPLLRSLVKEDNLPRRYRAALGEVANLRDICVIPADKGGKVVVLDGADYDKKCYDLLSNSEVYRLLDFNPLDRMVKNFKHSFKLLISDVPYCNTNKSKFLVFSWYL